MQHTDRILSCAKSLHQKFFKLSHWPVLSINSVDIRFYAVLECFLELMPAILDEDLVN